MLYWCAYDSNTKFAYFGTTRSKLRKLQSLRNVQVLTYESPIIIQKAVIYRVAMQLVQDKHCAPNNQLYDALFNAADIIVQRACVSMDMIKLIFECELSYHLMGDKSDLLTSMRYYWDIPSKYELKKVCTVVDTLYWFNG